MRPSLPLPTELEEAQEEKLGKGDCLGGSGQREKWSSNDCLHHTLLFIPGKCGAPSIHLSTETRVTMKFLLSVHTATLMCLCTHNMSPVPTPHIYSFHLQCQNSASGSLRIMLPTSTAALIYTYTSLSHHYISKALSFVSTPFLSLYHFLLAVTLANYSHPYTCPQSGLNSQHKHQWPSPQLHTHTVC